jgi:two-component system OmpR family response regulator
VTRLEANMKILLAEDDQEVASYVTSGLAELGHSCEHCATGRDALFVALDKHFDVAVLDRMLPGLDGLSLVRSMRAAGVRTPVLFLTNMSGIDDRVEAGADDYLLKPFAFSELVARIGALARRPPMSDQVTKLNVADLELDLVKRTARRAGRTIELQPREFQLLQFLMEHEGQIVTRTMLLEHVWDFHFDPKTNLVETHISRLRSKVDRGFEQDLIRTFRGSGYSIRAAA